MTGQMPHGGITSINFASLIGTRCCENRQHIRQYTHPGLDSRGEADNQTTIYRRSLVTHRRIISSTKMPKQTHAPGISYCLLLLVAACCNSWSVECGRPVLCPDKVIGNVGYGHSIVRWCQGALPKWESSLAHGEAGWEKGVQECGTEVDKNQVTGVTTPVLDSAGDPKRCGDIQPSLVTTCVEP